MVESADIIVNKGQAQVTRLLRVSLPHCPILTTNNGTFSRRLQTLVFKKYF